MSWSMWREIISLTPLSIRVRIVLKLLGKGRHWQFTNIDVTRNNNRSGG